MLVAGILTPQVLKILYIQCVDTHFNTFSYILIHFYIFIYFCIILLYFDTFVYAFAFEAVHVPLWTALEAVHVPLQ